MTPYLVIWSIALLVKLGLSAWLPLIADEAYYRFWSYHPQLSYFDHPPVIAFLYYLGRPLEFFGQAVRWPGIVLGHSVLLIWFAILRKHLAGWKMNTWLLLTIFSPFVGFGSLIVTPDTPLIFFWSATLYFMLKALEKQRLLYYLLAGASAGAGFCAKYHMALFLIITILWLIGTNRWREARWGHTSLAILVGFAFASPVLIWNIQNSFASFAFQAHHGLGKVWKPRWTADYTLGQIALIFPTILYFAVRARIPRSLDWAPFFAWTPLVFFFFATFRGRTEANWPAVAYPSIFLLAVLGIEHSKKLVPTIAVWISVIVLIFTQIIFSWLPISPDKLKTYEFTRYTPLMDAAKTLNPLYGGTYQISSMLSYSTKRPVYKLRGLSRRDFFDFLPQSLPNENSFYLAMRSNTPFPQWLLQDGYRARGISDVPNGFKIFQVIRE